MPPASDPQPGPPARAAAPDAAAAPPPSLLTPLAPARPRDAYELRRARDGSGDLLHDAGSWTARIASDGTVTFASRAATGLSLMPPWLPTAPAPSDVPSLQNVLGLRLGRGRAPARIEADAARPEAALLFPTAGANPYRPDPREACLYPRSCFFDAQVLLVGGNGRFDITDALPRGSLRDPHRNEKARFLAVTRELRIRMAARAHAQNLRRALDELPRRLDVIACDDRLAPVERRGILEALRTEMDNSTAEGRAAAAQISAFLDAHFDDAHFDARSVDARLGHAGSGAARRAAVAGCPSR